ncbi:fiber 2 [Simian adenovirus A1285]|uniref:Fiber 2 n=1 Tax=Simian adenovirus A1285 TaxID=1159190 RepID=H9AAN0_9ADEN|nr:fiber 2 [Simian adenovirus A1285]
MKRSRPADFNPVYPFPFSPPPFFITPPFVQARGLQESPRGVLSLRLGEGLSVDEQGAVTAAYRQAAAPLVLQNGTLALTYSSPLLLTPQNTLGLQVQHPLRVQNSSGLSLLTTPPLALGTAGLTLQTGGGLQVQDAALSARLGEGLALDAEGAMQVATTAAVTLQNRKVGLAVDWPLVATDKLRLLLARGLTVDPNLHQLGVDADPLKGLTFNNNQLAIKAGKGLIFDQEGFLTVAQAPATTLWTTSDPSPNCTVKEELDSKLSLALTKNGGQVHGLVSLLGLKGPLASIPASNMGWVTITLAFDNQGRLLFGEHTNLASSATWGYRQGQSVSPTAPENALAFMPNSSAYTPGQGQHTRNHTFVPTYMKADHQKPLSLQVTFNELSTGYCLRFTWMGVFHYPGEQFLAPPCAFSYLAEEE